MDTDDSFVLFRRFGRLRIRRLLYKQDRIAELERELYNLDNKEEDQINLVPRCWDLNEARIKILEEIDISLKDYDEALIASQTIYNFPKAEPANIRNLRNLVNNGTYLVDCEKTFLLDDDDLVAMTEDPVKEGMLIKWARLLAHKVFWKGYRSQDIRNTDENKYVTYVRDEHIKKISKGIITVFAPLLLLVPIIILCFLKTLLHHMLVIAGFTVGFSASLTLTNSKPAEIFSATAGYAAVMVVFLGSVTNPSN